MKGQGCRQFEFYSDQETPVLSDCGDKRRRIGIQAGFAPESAIFQRCPNLRHYQHYVYGTPYPEPGLPIPHYVSINYPHKDFKNVTEGLLTEPGMLPGTALSSGTWWAFVCLFFSAVWLHFLFDNVQRCIPESFFDIRKGLSMFQFTLPHSSGRFCYSRIRKTFC